VKPAASQAAEATTLAHRLESTFRAGGDAPSACAPGFPPQLWQPALLGPLREFLARPGKQLRAGLVELGFALAGGRHGACPPELPLLVEALHAGSLIVDDIEDGSLTRRGAPSLHARHGVPIALNTGNWLYFWAFTLLARSALDDAQRLHAHECIAARLLACHEGQALDLSVRVVDLAQREVAPVVRTLSACKTGGLLALSLELGAIAARAPERVRSALAIFGCEAGVGLQMFDDLSGVLNPRRKHKGREDLTLGRATWLWAWLSEDLDADTYAASCRALRALDDDAGAERLLERLRFAGQNGRRRARAQLEGALGALVAALGPSEHTRALTLELAALEQLYVER
jgi:geranylgeranyl pyrophosphate synthase